MILWCCQKLATGNVDSRIFWEGLLCRPRLAAAYALPVATWYVLQSYLQAIATCAGLGGAWERLSCKLRLVSTSVGHRAT